MRPGNTDAPKSRLIASIAAGPVSHAYSELRHYHEIFVERIKATSNSEKQLAQRREDNGQFEDWLEQYERKRRSVLKDLYGIVITQGDAPQPLPSISTVRQELETQIRSAMQGAFERLNERAATLAAEEARQITAGEEPKRALVAPESTDTPTMGEVTLIRPAPGTGKSYALGNVLDPRFIEGKSVVVLSETLELSK